LADCRIPSSNRDYLRLKNDSSPSDRPRKFHGDKLKILTPDDTPIAVIPIATLSGG
jgi:hypothetical protein